jgi:hypothetical protein
MSFREAKILSTLFNVHTELMREHLGISSWYGLAVKQLEYIKIVTYWHLQLTADLIISRKLVTKTLQSRPCPHTTAPSPAITIDKSTHDPTSQNQCCTRVENSRRWSRSRENRAVSKCLAGLVAVSTILDRSRRSHEYSVVSPTFRLLWCRRCCLGRQGSVELCTGRRVGARAGEARRGRPG